MTDKEALTQVAEGFKRDYMSGLRQMRDIVMETFNDQLIALDEAEVGPEDIKQLVMSSEQVQQAIKELELVKLRESTKNDLDDLLRQLRGDI